MNIAIFSDIHGNADALEVILKDIKKQKFDSVIFLGDAIGIGAESKNVLSY